MERTVKLLVLDSIKIYDLSVRDIVLDNLILGGPARAGGWIRHPGEVFSSLL